MLRSLPRSHTVRLVAIALLAALLATVPSAGNISAAEPNAAALAKQLSAADAKTRQHAADALAEMGAAAKPAVPALVKALDDKSAALQWRAARALGAVGAEARSAVPKLLALANSDDAVVRAQTAHALGAIGDKRPEVVDALAQHVLDKEASVRRTALVAIRALKLPRDVTIPLMVKVLHEAEPAVAVAALHTLAEAGDKAVPFLCDCCDDKEACYWACLALAEIGPAAKEAVPHLAKVLENEDPEVRLQALVALGNIGPDSKSALADITKALENDEFGGVRYAAAYALGRIGVADDAVRSALDAIVAGEEPFLKVVGAWALVKLAAGDKETVNKAVEVMIAGMESDQVDVRRASARALSETGAPPDVVGPLLVKLLKDADPEVVGNAIDALASLGPPIVPRLAKALGNEDLRLYATRVLGRIGATSQEAAPALITALAGADNPEFRRELQYALGAAGPAAAEAVSELGKSLANDDEQVRHSAVFALGRIGPAAKAAVPELRKLLDSKDEFDRDAGFWALARILPTDKKLAAQALPVFTKSLSSDSEVDRIEAAESLGLLGAAAKSSLPALKKAAADSNPTVAEAAAAAVKKIQGAK